MPRRQATGRDCHAAKNPTSDVEAATLVSNPYAVSSQAPSAEALPPKSSRLRLVVSVPLYLLGGFNALALLLTPYTVGEALRRTEEHGWYGTFSDHEFLISFLRATHTPFVGLCLLVIAFGFQRCKNWFFYGGILALISSFGLLYYVFS